MKFSKLQIQEISNLMLKEWIFNEIKTLEIRLKISSNFNQKEQLINQVYQVVRDQNLIKKTSVKVLCLWAILFSFNKDDWHQAMEFLSTLIKVATTKPAGEYKVFKAILSRCL